MEDNRNPAADTPAPATDPAPSERPSEAPTAAAEQGTGDAAADVTKPDVPLAETPDSEATDTPEPVQAEAVTPEDEAPGVETLEVEAAEVDPAEAETAEAETAEAETVQAEMAVDEAVEVEAAEPEAPETVTAEVEAVSEETSDAAAQAVAEAAPATEAEAATASAEPEPEPGDAGQANAPEIAPAAAAAAAAAASAPADDAEMTMEDVLAASDEQLARKPIHRGMITTGQVIMLAQDGIIVDVNSKIEGLLPYNQLFEFEADAAEAAKYFKPGDDIQVYVVRADIPNNTIILSKKRADQERAWNLLQEIHEKDKPVEVEIVEKVKGGLVANLGVRAFLPASQVDIRRVNDLSPFVGERLKVKIIELNRKRNRVIISRRSILEEEIAEQKEDTLKKLEPGLKTEGEVVEITDFGAFVNLGGIDGLVHRSELTHGRFNHPREVVKIGQKVKVEVLDLDLERERINLSMKSLVANPWDNVLANYSIGQKIGGRVTNLTQFGAFVEIEPGLEGLIHVSEMSWTKRIRHPKEVLEEGEEVEAMILKIDTNQQRISLGLRQTQPDPWSSLPDRYPPGTEVTGPITGITDFGVFMEIEEGIEGLVHISELSHDHIDNIAEHFDKGDEVTAVILNIDPVEQRASLSRKRLIPYTASAASEFGGNVPMGDPGRGPAAGGGRRGRRGRRSADIDYDYSYAEADSASRTTTKLGDVYADLFAQFGLGEGGGDEGQADEDDAESEVVEAEAVETETVEAERVETVEATEVVETAPTEGHDDATEATAEVEALVSDEAEEAVEAVAEEAPDDGGEAEAEVATEAPVEVTVAEVETEPEVDPADAIDAAEAAAMLTAAFREGKRPPKQEEKPEAVVETETEEEAQKSEA